MACQFVYSVEFVNNNFNVCVCVCRYVDSDSDDVYSGTLLNK